MKAVIISYGGAEVLQYADIETPQIKSDQQRLSLGLQLLRSRIQQQSNSSVYAYILIRIRKRFANSLPLSVIASFTPPRDSTGAPILPRTQGTVAASNG